MLIANNKGMGMSFGFPDACLTPMGVVVPFPNFSFNAMLVPFSINVWLSMMPAVTIASRSPITMGDNLGTAHWTFMGSSSHTLGNPRTLFNFLPSTSLAMPRMGNNFNCPLGLQVVPSLTNVFLSYNTGDAAAEGSTTAPPDVDRLLASLDLAGNSGSPVEHRLLADGTGYLRIRRFSLDVPSRVHTALAALREEGIAILVLDLRDNPGGELTAALELAGDFLAPGSVIARAIDGDGDETVYRSSHAPPCELPLQILVNRRTASAAELFAGSLQWHGRAVILGEATFGKGTALSLKPSPEDRTPMLAAGASLALPDGRPIHGVGIRPDSEIEAIAAA
jgi:carboxyl-terminal processing protease